MKQLDKLIDFLLKCPLLGIGVCAICMGATPAGVTLIASHFLIDRFCAQTTQDGKDNKNND